MTEPAPAPTADDDPAGPVAVVVVAHGSRAAAANDAHLAVVERLDAATTHAVSAAFLELAEPSIPDGIDAAVAAGARQVLVLPHFLYPGRHVAEDLPAFVAAADARHGGASVRLLDAFGADPAVIDLLADQVHRALDGR